MRHFLSPCVCLCLQGPKYPLSCPFPFTYMCSYSNERVPILKFRVCVQEISLLSASAALFGTFFLPSLRPPNCTTTHTACVCEGRRRRKGAAATTTSPSQSSSALWACKTFWPGPERDLFPLLASRLLLLIAEGQRHLRAWGTTTYD